MNIAKENRETARAYRNAMRAMCSTGTPKTYLSAACGHWTVIHQGVPICAPTDVETAKRAAANFKLELPAIYWNGYTGEFLSL
jgi:hypothetical protein